MVHDAEVVRDEQQGGAVGGPDAGEQIEHLRLDGHVQCGDRLVTDDQAGPRRQRAGDGNPLPLTAAKLSGIAVDQVGGEADALQERHDSGPCGAVQCLGHDPADRPVRSTVTPANCGSNTSRQ